MLSLVEDRKTGYDSPGLVCLLEPEILLAAQGKYSANVLVNSILLVEYFMMEFVPHES